MGEEAREKEEEKKIGKKQEDFGKRNYALTASDCAKFLCCVFLKKPGKETKNTLLGEARMLVSFLRIDKEVNY